MRREKRGYALVNGQIQYGAADPMTSAATHATGDSERIRRLRQFRHAIAAAGERPSRLDLARIRQLAHDLYISDAEISEELALLRALEDGTYLYEQIARGDVPVVASVGPLAPGDDCHFVSAVRFGRRRSDHYGHLLLTSGWIKFRGALDSSVPWTDVADVQRSMRDIIVSLQDSRRVLRFACPSIDEAVRGTIIAQHLAAISHPASAEESRPQHAAL